MIGADTGPEVSHHGGMHNEHPFFRAWSGRERLVVVYWVYGVLLGILFVVTGLAVQNFAIPLLAGFAAMNVAYVIWSTVALWRCAYNCNRRIYGHLARLIAVVTTAKLFSQFAAIGYSFI